MGCQATKFLLLGLHLNILGQPSDTLSVSLAHDNTAHEDLNRTNALERNLALTSSLVETKLVTQLILADGIGVVDLVSENKERHLGEVLHGEKSIQFGLGLVESLVVDGVTQEHNTGHFGEIILPETTGLLVTTEIEGGETVVADGKLLGGRVGCRLQDGDTVVLQHVQQGGLSCIIESEEQKLGAFGEKAERCKDIVEPVDNPHGEGVVRKGSRERVEIGRRSQT